MSRRERDPSLPAVPEDSEAKVRSSAVDWNDEDADDQEEQGLFELDNVASDAANKGENATPARGDYPLSNDGEDTNEQGVDVDDGPGIDPGPIYVQSAGGDSWELTWPIWHLLPRNERHNIASQHGMKTIGEFEEYMTLARAVDESEGANEGWRSGVVVLPNNNSSVDQEQSADVGAADRSSSNVAGAANESTADTSSTWQPPFIRDMGDEDDDDDVSISSSERGDITEFNETTNEIGGTEIEDQLELIRLGGLPCSLPEEVLAKCFAFLPVDDHAALALVSPYWRRFARCESLYQRLCERVYLNQSKKKTLHISRFGNSYRKMLELRPRVRAGGGLYVLKYLRVLKIERDMWTDVPTGAVLESVYYRYVYFFEDGRMLYALTHVTPVEMIPRFSKMLRYGPQHKDKFGVWGRYQIRKDTVRVWASQDWTDVCFQLKVIPSNKETHYAMGDKGMYTTMELEKHMTSQMGNFDEDSSDLVNYDIPDQRYFRFLRDRRL